MDFIPLCSYVHKVNSLARFARLTQCHTSCLVVFVQVTKWVSSTLRGPDIEVGGFKICTNAPTEKSASLPSI